MKTVFNDKSDIVCLGVRAGFGEIAIREGYDENISEYFRFSPDQIKEICFSAEKYGKKGKVYENADGYITFYKSALSVTGEENMRFEEFFHDTHGKNGEKIKAVDMQVFYIKIKDKNIRFTVNSDPLSIFAGVELDNTCYLGIDYSKCPSVTVEEDCFTVKFGSASDTVGRKEFDFSSLNKTFPSPDGLFLTEYTQIKTFLNRKNEVVYMADIKLNLKNNKKKTRLYFIAADNCFLDFTVRDAVIRGRFLSDGRIYVSVKDPNCIEDDAYFTCNKIMDEKSYRALYGFSGYRKNDDEYIYRNQKEMMAYCDLFDDDKIKCVYFDRGNKTYEIIIRYDYEPYPEGETHLESPALFNIFIKGLIASGYKEVKGCRNYEED